MASSSSHPKIVILNMPSGFSLGETFPIAVSRVIDGLDPSLECMVEFIDLGYTEMSFDEIRAKLEVISPNVIGFSAILTHAYSYVSDLSRFLKKHFPQAVQVLGGQMAVISNLLLQKTDINFCVAGESEPTFSGLLKKLMNANYDLSDTNIFLDIPGLVFNYNKIPRFTGYSEPAKNCVLQMNYGLMSKHTDTGRFFPKVVDGFYKRSINKYEIDSFFGLLHAPNIQKNIAKVSPSKGCVGRCTFCHRFFKGYRAMEPDSVINQIEEIKKFHEIGFIEFFGEHFGADKKGTKTILDHLKRRGLNWSASTRVRSIDEATISQWKEAGCVCLSFGIESCSEKMLEVMEKMATVAENLNAINLCFKHGIYTTILLLIGMPGETEETISETICNLTRAIPDDIAMPYEICINYFQAIPGTPGYEYARNVGLIGPSLNDEEDYIKALYGVNANNIKHYLNFTDYEKEETVYWKNYIFLELIVAYIKKHGLFRTLKHKKVNRYKYAAVYMLLPAGLRRFLLKYLMIIVSFGAIAAIKVICRKLFKKKPLFFGRVSSSLREINKQIELPVRPDDVYTHELRKGR